MSQLTGSPSIKVVALGRASIQLVEDLPIMAGVDYCKISGADYSWEDYVWSALPLNNASLIKELSRIKYRHSLPVLKSDWKYVAEDLKKLDTVKALVQSREQEILTRLQGADMVLLVISLDNELSYAACEILAKLSRDTGALTIALIGAPYYDFIPDATRTAINSVLNQADSVIASDGMWNGSNFKKLKWGWWHQTDVPNNLLGYAAKSNANFNQLKQMFTQSGRSVCGQSFGDSVVEAVECTLYQSLFQWFHRDGYVVDVATSGLVTVSADWQSVGNVLDEVKAILSQNAPLTDTGKPYWHGAQQLIVTAAEDDSWLMAPYISVNIISTGVELKQML